MRESNVSNIKNRLFSSKEVLSGFFFPVQKFTHNSPVLKEFEANKGKVVVNTKFGKIEVRNRLLTEYHYRILSEIIEVSKIENTEKGLRATFSELEVMSALGMGNSNHTQLREMVKQIADATFYIGIARQRGVKILESHTIDTIGVQTVLFSKEYVEMNQLDFAISSTVISKKLRDLRISTVPSLIRYIYNASRGMPKHTFQLDDILDGIGFNYSVKSLNTLKSWLKQNESALKEDFYIQYEPRSKMFTTTPELSDKLTFIQAAFDETIFEQYVGYELPSSLTDGIASKIVSIKKLNYREYEILTEHHTLHLESFLDDFMAFLDDVKNEKVKNQELLCKLTSSPT